MKVFTHRPTDPTTGILGGRDSRGIGRRENRMVSSRDHEPAQRMVGSPLLQEPKRERIGPAPAGLPGFFGHLGGISRRSDQPTSTARLSNEIQDDLTLLAG